mgnify:CR=1 FL=1
MARNFNQDDIDRLKKNVSILHVTAGYGIELKPHGRSDYIGRCPLPGHTDEEPSFIVTPGKNLWHCMGCDKGGSVIDLVMELDGITFRDAVDKLMTSTGLVQRGTGITQDNPPQKEPDKKQLSPERAAQLLERCINVYEKNFANCPDAVKYLEQRGITDAALFTRHRIGYSTGKLSDILPDNGGIRDDLKTIGVLLDTKHERFTDCLVFPVLDVEGQITTLYGRYTGQGDPSTGSGQVKRHLYLPNRPTGLWNATILKTCADIILVESAIDALSVEVAGYPNVIAVQGTNGLKDSDIDTLKTCGVQKVTLLLDGDEAGQKAAKRLAARLGGSASGGKESDYSFSCSVVTLPDGHDPNSYLVKYGAEKLGELINTQAVRTEAGSAETHLSACPSNGPDADRRAGDQQEAARSSSDGLLFTWGLRKYHIMGLEKGSRKLRATVRIEHAGKLHVDTLDFYSARSRRMLAADLCRIFEESPETIEADITRLLQELEKAPVPGKDEQTDRPVAPTITPRDRTEAVEFGKASDLIDRILAGCEILGLVGETANKLLSYLAAVSRKMDDPISVLVLSSSGAGKTALQDTALSFVPPEDLVKLTSLSGKALFYKDRLALKHKVLALEEGDGAEEASYAIRNLISARELVIESTIKDLSTGRLTTMENRVEGPTSVFITTTDPETDPETRSRFFVTSIDESPEQTRAILDFQRKRHTLEGLETNTQCDDILRVHRNFQRLLKPVAVVNPYADRLTYADDRLQGRRDQPKYLNLIKAVAFLRQMQKEIRYARRNGESVPYIEVDLEDVRIANKLAHEILGHSLDELSRPGRALLLLLDEMVEQIVERLKKESSTGGPGGNPDHRQNRTSITFSRRDIREFSGWAHTRVHRYLKELIELEYVIQESGRNGSMCRYRLAYEGQGKNGERFMLGLTDPEDLKDNGRPE